MLAFIVGLPAEARLARHPVFIGGGQAEGAARAACHAIDAGASALVSFGLAGGLSPDLPAGAIVVPGGILWRGRQLAADPALCAALGGNSASLALASDKAVVKAADKARLWHETGAVAVDMESGAVAQAAERAGIPFGVVRAVCDPAWRDLPPAALAALDRTGVIGMGRVLRSVLRRPGQVGALLALARDAALARRALVRRLAQVQAGGALLSWG